MGRYKLAADDRSAEIGAPARRRPRRAVRPRAPGTSRASPSADCERRGDYPSLLFEGRWHGSGELFERAARMAAAWPSWASSPGERVVVRMANCPEVSIVYQALWRAGAVVTPVTFLLGRPSCATCSPTPARAVVTTPEFLDKVRGVRRAAELRTCSAPRRPTDAVLRWPRSRRREPAPIVDRADDDLAALLYTGGTTGRAKGVMLSHASLHYTGQAAYAPPTARASPGR